MAFQGLRSVIGAFRTRRSGPPGVREWAEKVKTLLEQSETEAAGQLLLEALERFPGHSSLEDINHFLGQKRLHDGLAQLRGVVEEARKAYIRTARAFADTDNEEKAIEFITGALRRFAECAQLHLILGEVYLRRYLEDKIPEHGRRASESLERAFQIGAPGTLPRKYLAGLYVRVGCFRQAQQYLAMVEAKSDDEEERTYAQELRDYCIKHAVKHDEDFEHCLSEVWEHGTFAVDCHDWAMPGRPAFGRRDSNSIMLPFVVMEVTAKKCVELPGVAAVVVQNQARSLTFKAEDVEVSDASIEDVVREVADSALEACRRMKLGHVRRCELKTTAGRLSLHVFADSCVALLFKKNVSTTQVRTVTQQFLDMVAERMGEIHEDNS